MVGRLCGGGKRSQTNHQGYISESHLQGIVTFLCMNAEAVEAWQSVEVPPPNTLACPPHCTSAPVGGAAGSRRPHQGRAA